VVAQALEALERRNQRRTREKSRVQKRKKENHEEAGRKKNANPEKHLVTYRHLIFIRLRTAAHKIPQQ